jgi:hypothetical protein
MAGKKRADHVGVGEEFEPFEFRVTADFNLQYLESVEDFHPRYLNESALHPPIVHPALLIVNSNVTRSPSFYLPDGTAAVHAKEEVEYINPGRVGKTFRVTWKVTDMYEKRGRPYQVKEVLIVDEDGVEILRRKITDTYMGGER